MQTTSSTIESPQPLTQYGILSVTGTDAPTFLQGMLTTDIERIPPASLQYGAFCDRKGRVLANFHLYRDDAGLHLMMPNTMTHACCNALTPFARFSKVTMVVRDDLAITGYINPTDIKSDAQTHVRQLPGEPARTVHISTAAPADTTPAPSSATWDLANIRAGIAYITPATSLAWLPHMLAMPEHDGVHFNKGCYIGQEIIARTEHLGKVKRKLTHHCYPADTSLTVGEPLPDQENSCVITWATAPDQQRECLAVTPIAR